MIDWQKELTKALVSIAIALLKSVIPWLGGFLGGPLGFILTPLIGWLTGMLYDLVERYLRFSEIDRVIEKQLEQAKTKTDALKEAQKNPGGEDHAKALAEFRIAVRDLGRLRVQ